MDDAKEFFGNIGKAVAFIPAITLGCGIELIGEIVGEEEKGDEIAEKVVSTTLKIGKSLGQALPVGIMAYTGRTIAEKKAEKKN